MTAAQWLLLAACLVILALLAWLVVLRIANRKIDELLGAAPISPAAVTEFGKRDTAALRHWLKGAQASGAVYRPTRGAK